MACLKKEDVHQNYKEINYFPANEDRYSVDKGPAFARWNPKKKKKNPQILTADPLSCLYEKLQFNSIFKK